MSESSIWNIHIDGAARGNPGPAAFAFVIKRDGATAVEEHGHLGTATNNHAEYTALIRALERAAHLGGRRLLIHSDSELLVKQMNGEYRVKNENLRELFDAAKVLCRKFSQVTIRHVPREQNKVADRLCNEALDLHGNVPAATHHKKKPVKSAAVPSSVHEEAIECLRAVARQWSQGSLNDPAPELVWDQLWSILEEHNIVKASR